MVNYLSSTPTETGPYNVIETASHRLGRKAADPALKTADDMSLAHNMFIRGLNACILQAKGVQESQDVQGLVQFGLLFKASLDHHHRTEEEHFFAPLEEALKVPGRMGNNIDQHKGFHHAGEEFEEYCNRMLANPDQYDGDEFLRVTRKFGDPLVEHLHEEIDDLLDLKLSGIDPDLSVSNQCFKDWEKYLLESYDPYVLGVYVLYTNDHNYEDGMFTHFPPYPILIRPLLKYWYSRRHSNAWRFAPCPDEIPTKLAFLPEAVA